MLPLVSICIPAYEQPELLHRCLQSIAEQDYPNIEVVVTDDTPNERVKIICKQFEASLRLRYFQNIPALGSPANWNAALDTAVGTFSLLLHHDDWLAGKSALSDFTKPLISNKAVDAAFGITVTTDESGTSYEQRVDVRAIHQRPALLLLANKIGPPSNVLFRSSIRLRYRNEFRWLVDIDWYMQLLLEQKRFAFIPEKLIEVGVHDAQTTQFFMANPQLVLVEHIRFAQLYSKHFSGWELYDYFWRLLRNTNANMNLLHEQNIHDKEVPAFLMHMIQMQQKWPRALLYFGPFSKLLMLHAYSLYGFKN